MSIKPLGRFLRWVLLGIFAAGMCGAFLAPTSFRSASFICGLSSLIFGLLLSLSVGVQVAPRSYPKPQWRAALAVVNVALVVVIALMLWRSYVVERRLGHLDLMFILEGSFAAVALLLLRGVSKRKLAEATPGRPPNHHLSTTDQAKSGEVEAGGER